MICLCVTPLCFGPERSSPVFSVREKVCSEEELQRERKELFLEGKSRDFTMREREKHNCSIYLLSSLAEEEVLLVRNIV